MSILSALISSALGQEQNSFELRVVGPGDQFSFTFQTVGTIRITAHSTGRGRDRCRWLKSLR